MNMRLVDMSPGLRIRVQAALDRRGATKSRPKASGKPAGKIKRYTGGVYGPNATEAEYNARFLGGAGIYEGVTLRLPGGSRYTPDWLSVCPLGFVHLHEVKGAYRFHSEGRAWTAFREARAAFPMFRFHWAKRTKAGVWEVR